MVGPKKAILSEDALLEKSTNEFMLMKNNNYWNINISSNLCYENNNTIKKIASVSL